MRPRPPLSLEIAAARGVAALSRRLGTGGGTTIPGQAPRGARPRRHRPPRRAAHDRDGRRLGDERQDDDDRDGGRDPAAHGTGSPTTRPARISSRASPLRYSPPGTPISGLFEVDEAALPEVVRRLRPRAVCLGNLFRDQLDRYGELELVAERWRDAVATLPGEAQLVYNADDPQLAAVSESASGQRRLRPRRSSRGASVAPACGRLEVLRPLRHAVRLRGGVRRPPRRLPLPARPPCPAAARGRGPGHLAARARARLVPARHARGVTADRASRCRASTTSTTRWQRPRSHARSARSSTRSPPASLASPPPSAASSASPSAGSRSFCS